MAPILNMLVVFWVFKIDIRDTRRVFFRFRIFSAILKVANGETFEFHHILSKSASLVAKDVVHHSKLFIQVRRLDRRLHPCIRIDNVDVLRYEPGLDEVNHLKRDEQRDRDKVH